MHTPEKPHLLLAALLLLCACQGDVTAPAQSTGDPMATDPVASGYAAGCVVGPVPEAFGFDPFYAKYCDAGGIPVISSADVSDLALGQAYDVIMNMLAPIPIVREEMIAHGAYFAVIGIRENLTTLPEYADMNSDYWDRRARGLGGSIPVPITSTAEENLLCLPWDHWYGESIAVHEFAHTISLMGMGEDFDRLTEEFNGLYTAALEQGLWADTYAGSDILEYWAEGVQSYFNTNLEADPVDGVHNHVNTRAELAEYDPTLYEFIAGIFHDNDWTYNCPKLK